MTILTGVSWYLAVVLIFISLILSKIEHLFMCHIFILPFHTVHGVFKVRILKWFAIPTSLSSQNTFFPVVMYGCESWTIKKSERQRTDTFELWYWIRLLRVPWTARRSNQSILKEISPEYSLEGLMLKLKLQYLAT